jgi:hypothetical protein
MAALSTIVVSAASPAGATITFNAAAIDVNSCSLAQLKQVVDKLMMTTVGRSSDTGCTVTLPAGF